MGGRHVAVNESGLRIGEDHPRAQLTDCEVDLVRRLHEQGLSYAQLAEKFGVSKWSIARICRYERRAQVAVRVKTVHIPGDA